MEFQLDDENHLCPAGSVVFAPRGTAHTFMNPGPDTARILAFVTAAALPLVEALGNLAAQGPPDPAAIRSLLARHQTEVVPRS